MMLENAKFNSFQLGIAWNLVSAAILNIIQHFGKQDTARWKQME